MATPVIAENTHQPFRLIKSTRGAYKMIEGGYIYGQQRRAGEVIHWQCERRGVCKARIHTKGMQIIKRTNEHLFHSVVQQLPMPIFFYVVTIILKCLQLTNQISSEVSCNKLSCNVMS